MGGWDRGIAVSLRPGWTTEWHCIKKKKIKESFFFFFINSLKITKLKTSWTCLACISGPNWGGVFLGTKDILCNMWLLQEFRRLLWVLCLFPLTLPLPPSLLPFSTSTMETLTVFCDGKWPRRWSPSQSLPNGVLLHYDRVIAAAWWGQGNPVAKLELAKAESLMDLTTNEKSPPHSAMRPPMSSSHWHAPGSLSTA